MHHQSMPAMITGVRRARIDPLVLALGALVTAMLAAEAAVILYAAPAFDSLAPLYTT